MTKPMSYFEFCQEWRGVQFRSNGRIICKAAAFELYRLGRWEKNMVTLHPKPGWYEGELCILSDYIRYLESVKF